MEAGQAIRRALLLTALLLAGLVTTSAAAAEGKRERGDQARSKRTVARLTEEVGLRVEQQDAIRTILEERSKTLRELRERARSGTDREAVKSEIETLIESSSAQVEAVLDEDQIPKYRKFRQERREQARRRGRRPWGGRPR